MPGDSPMGFRLPLDVAAVGRSRRRRTCIRADPVRHARPTLPDRIRPTQRVSGAATPRERAAQPDAARPAPAPSCEPRSAWSRATDVSACSCRRSRALEDYLELVAAVEDTAAELDMPVHLEGYEPPRDPRLQR